jgi:hypothetical protein
MVRRALIYWVVLAALLIFGEWGVWLFTAGYVSYGLPFTYYTATSALPAAGISDTEFSALGLTANLAIYLAVAVMLARLTRRRVRG